MLKKLSVILMGLVMIISSVSFAFGQDEEGKMIERAPYQGVYSDGDLEVDRVTGVENITGYDYIYSNPASSDQISITLQNTQKFTIRRHYYYGGLHNCYLNTLIYIGGGFGNNTGPKEIPGDIALVRISDSVKNGAGEKFDLVLLIKNLRITPSPEHCTRDPKVGVNLFYYQEGENPIISTTPSAYDAFGTTSQAPTLYGRYTVAFEYEIKVVYTGTDEAAPQGTLLYGSRDFDSYQEGYDILSGVVSGPERDKPTIYVEPDTITAVSYRSSDKCYRICGTAADENTWRSGFAALFDSAGATLRWFGFGSLGTTIIGQEAYEFQRYFSVRGEIVKGEGTIEPVDVTVSKGMNVNCVIDPADDYYISAIRLYSADDQGTETLINTFDSEDVNMSDPYYVPIENIDRDYRYEVEFEKKYLIRLKVINGIVGESGNLTEAAYRVIPGSDLELKYSAKGRYELRTIEVDGSYVSIDGYLHSYSFSDIQSDHEVTVTYERKYTVETSVTNGTITDSVTLWNGESAVIEYSPDPGYHLSSVTVDGEKQDITQYPERYTFECVKSNHRIEVVYEANSALISKVDQNGDILQGAVLQIVDGGGNMLDEWTTEGDDHLIIGLAAGTYTLHEKTAPSGYMTAPDIEFVIDDRGTVTVDGAETEKVLMVDQKIQILPSTGGNGAAVHMMLLGIMIIMLSTAVRVTKRI